MARTNIPYTKLVDSGSPSTVNAVPLDATNDHVITHAMPEDTILVVTNTDAGSDHDVTIKAGTYPPAPASGQGGLTFNVPASGSAYFGPFESGRFMQNDGSVLLDVESGHTGTVTALRMPKGALR